MVVLFLIIMSVATMIPESGRSAGKTPARILDIYSNFAGNPACFHILGFAPISDL